jgi:hypothetical protein
MEPENRTPELEARNQQLRQEASELAQFPTRSGISPLATLLNMISRLYPPMLTWILLGIIGFLLYPTNQGRILLFPWILGIALCVLPVVGVGPNIFYRMHFDPIFMLFGIVGMAVIWQRVFRETITKRGLAHSDAGNDCIVT